MEGVRPQRPETHQQAFERVIGQAVTNALVMLGVGDETHPLYIEAQGAMPVLRDEWDRRFNGDLDQIVQDRIHGLRQRDDQPV